jgi:hypothetical protein
MRKLFVKLRKVDSWILAEARVNVENERKGKGKAVNNTIPNLRDMYGLKHFTIK